MPRYHSGTGSASDNGNVCRRDSNPELSGSEDGATTVLVLKLKLRGIASPGPLAGLILHLQVLSVYCRGI